MKKRNREIDFLKFVCAFLVICINVPFANIFSAIIGYKWFYAVVMPN